MMTTIRAETGRGWAWLVEGWRLFVKAPGLWIVIVLVYLAISMALSLIPPIGVIVHVLLNPVLVAGMVYGAAQLACDKPLKFGHLFQGFQDQERLGSLILLGLLSLASGIATVLAAMVFVGGGLVAGIVLGSTGTSIPSGEASGIAVGAGFMVAALVALIVGLVVTMALFYGVPLVMLGRQGAWSATQASIMACSINMGPLGVFSLIYILLAVVAAIPMGLGFLILGPVTVCSVYASYREVFEHPEDLFRMRLEK